MCSTVAIVNEGEIVYSVILIRMVISRRSASIFLKLSTKYELFGVVISNHPRSVNEADKIG